MSGRRTILKTNRNEKCFTRRRGKLLELVSPSFTFQLDTSRGLRAVAWHNHLTGRALSLGKGAEFKLDLDAAQQRLYIRGWRGAESQEGEPLPNRDRGFRDGWFRPEFDDADWESSFSATHWAKSGSRYCWARTHLFLPEEWCQKNLTLVLGGLGLFDYRFMRVFIGGRLLGVRRVEKRWHEPAEFDLAKLREYLRFGQDNVIALQLAGVMVRSARMGELDPQAARALPPYFVWPGQFEQYVRSGNDFRAEDFRVANVRVVREGKAGRIQIALHSRQTPIHARVQYDWDAGTSVLRKQVTLKNASRHDVRVMRLHLGDYKADTQVTEGEQGFPVYLNDEFFMTLAHPAGWAMGQAGNVKLRQYPGQRLVASDSFVSMEAIYGVADQGSARKEFLRHIQSRMRRVRRGHDKPYTIFEPFGSWPLPKGKMLSDVITEKIILDNLRKVARGQRDSDARFDFYSIEFWADVAGNLEQPHSEHFPRGFSRIWRELRRLGIKSGLWICSSEGRWANGANPALSPSRGCDPAWFSPPPDPAFSANDPKTVTYLCRASEPARTMYTQAFRHHLRHNKVRLLKFDGFYPICYNDDHDHLPGIYSTEAIANSFIEFLQALDSECHDVFMMLYWGHRSPWWLLHADTLFEPGLLMEAASPAPSPTLYARDGVTQGLDQAKWFCQDVPALGKDSLGVWLSDWGWNSCIGNERWQEAAVMDLCRGSLLVQPWSDLDWLTPPQRKQFARFVALLRAQTNCFRNPRFILGNPWKNEPYGYECRDGSRAFIAIHNCSWQDMVVDLQRLLPAESCDTYRWHPRPAKIVGDTSRIALRPFAVTLLEFVKTGAPPAMAERLPADRFPQAFEEATTTIAVKLDVKRRGKPISFRLTGQIPRNSAGGMLVIAADRRRKTMAYQTRTAGRELLLRGAPGAKATIGQLTQHPNSWQAWRIPIRASKSAAKFVYTLAAELPDDVELSVQGWFIPHDQSASNAF